MQEYVDQLTPPQEHGHETPQDPAHQLGVEKHMKTIRRKRRKVKDKMQDQYIERDAYQNLHILK